MELILDSVRRRKTYSHPGPLRSIRLQAVAESVEALRVILTMVVLLDHGWHNARATWLTLFRPLQRRRVRFQHHVAQPVGYISP